jgi:hypothetical protein
VLGPLDRLQGKEEKVPTSVSVSPPYAVQYRKSGRLITLGKVFRQSDGSLALGTPYANRRFATPSLPPAVLEYLLDAGVRDWVIRFDRLGTAYRLPLVEVERLATTSPDGELAVPFRHFERCPYPDWPYAERAVLLDHGSVDV